MKSLNIHDLAHVCGGLSSGEAEAPRTKGTFDNNLTTLDGTFLGGSIRSAPGVLESDPIFIEGPGRGASVPWSGFPRPYCPVAEVS